MPEGHPIPPPWLTYNDERVQDNPPFAPLSDRPDGQPQLIPEQGVFRPPARMCLAVPENLADAFSARFQEHEPRALAPDSGQEADQELVAGEGAVGHVVERQRVGQVAGAGEFQAVGEQEQTDLRAGDGVVTVGDRVDDGLVYDVEVVAGAAGRGAGGLHEADDEGDAGVDLVGDRPDEALGVNEIVGGKRRACVAGRLDGTGREKGGRLGAENEQAGDRGPVPPPLRLWP